MLNCGKYEYLAGMWQKRGCKQNQKTCKCFRITAKLSKGFKFLKVPSVGLFSDNLAAV